MPDKPVPEQDPITSKSYAAHYVIATILLIATLFWALWDEAWGQRPWKAFQDQWKDRYSAFLNTARSKSAQSEKDVEQSPDYIALKQAYQNADQSTKDKAAEVRSKLDDATARLLAVQSVFTDRRAYVNALTYELETSTSASAKASKQKDIDAYKAEEATVQFPDGSKQQFTFPEIGGKVQRNPRREDEVDSRTRRREEASHRGPRKDRWIYRGSSRGPDTAADRWAEEACHRVGSGDCSDQCGRREYR